MYCHEKVGCVHCSFIHCNSFPYCIVRYMCLFHSTNFHLCSPQYSIILFQRQMIHSNDKGISSSSNKLEDTRLEEDRWGGATQEKLQKVNGRCYCQVEERWLCFWSLMLRQWSHSDEVSPQKCFVSGKYFIFFSEWIINIFLYHYSCYFTGNYEQ